MLALARLGLIGVRLCVCPIPQRRRGRNRLAACGIPVEKGEVQLTPIVVTQVGKKRNSAPKRETSIQIHDILSKILFYGQCASLQLVPQGRCHVVPEQDRIKNAHGPHGEIIRCEKWELYLVVFGSQGRNAPNKTH